MRSISLLHRIGTALVGLALLPCTLPASAASPEVEDVRQAIKAHGGRWHADDTSMTRLSPRERGKRLGLREDGDTAATSPTLDTAPIPLVTAAPPTLDWRNSAGISYVTPVKDQGACGSCWAFAVTGALESQVMLGTAGAPVDLSEQILVSCSGAGSCSGGYVGGASNYIRDVGLPVEGCLVYTATNNSCSNACANWQGDTDKVKGWHTPAITTTLVDAIRNALYAYGPVVATMSVYNDFYSYRSGVYSYTTGSYAGGHAVLVVGYDDVSQSFLVKNSWGSGWGEAGYFQIAYSETTGTSRFGSSTLVYDGYAGTPPAPDTTAPTASIVAPGAGATLSATTTVSVSASDDVGVSSVALYLDGTLLAGDATLPYSFVWDTTKSVNGAHTLQAAASDAAGNTGLSAPVTAYVSNLPDTTPPTVTIASPVDGSRISKVVKIKVNAADASRLQRIDVQVDGKALGSAACSASSCAASFNWNSGSTAKGAHTIAAYAYDAASNRGAASVTVYK